jgi:hypothetical protein
MIASPHCSKNEVGTELIQFCSSRCGWQAPSEEGCSVNQMLQELGNDGLDHSGSPARRTHPVSAGGEHTKPVGPF